MQQADATVEVLGQRHRAVPSAKDVGALGIARLDGFGHRIEEGPDRATIGDMLGVTRLVPFLDGLPDVARVEDATTHALDQDRVTLLLAQRVVAVRFEALVLVLDQRRHLRHGVTQQAANAVADVGGLLGIDRDFAAECEIVAHEYPATDGDAARQGLVVATAQADGQGELFGRQVLTFLGYMT